MYKGGQQPTIKGAQPKKEADVVVLQGPYPYRLSFYDRPPLYDVTIEDFETFALDRLRILAEIEASYARNRSWDELRTVTEAQCKKYDLWLSSNTARSQFIDLERKKDHLSHFVLRLAFCRSEELRRRFVKAETTLFRVRYEKDDTKELTQFLSSQDFGWEKVDPPEKATYESELRALLPNVGDKEFKDIVFYKVKWTRVPDLVAKRRVFLRRGQAFVPTTLQASIVFHAFETQLEKALERTAKGLPRLDEDTRIVPILNNLSQGFLAGVPSEWTNATPTMDGELRAEMVDGLAKKHFPMCMRNLHESLMRDHHLKHFGRLQYGLFLKVLGLSIEEAVAFWRKSFSSITDDKFNKEYKYNIRHSYGLEGKRANYPAKSCQQILLSDQPGPSDCHGCPYRHFAPDNLQTSLLTYYSNQGLTSSNLPEIMKTVKEGHYHVACTRVFEITHTSKGVEKGQGIGSGESVTHPNQYAARSRELEKPQEGGTSSDTAMVVG
ncbi:DNA primase, large subunit [Coniophora puteana RWD-64-598 SS2]|uniref:DNA primase large subunit n=1 Tax=Coniophora puteana (strain RWD-64-598) TaxID=741705 RepID=A0A5M3N0V1_CONPW|nr:DNA primase, large subunit [Coniophora puteana RWD-64-598 SS2]EIW85012.1 DNA primase, large subunit [Coniophora puteana RWD-64-598 SS2]